VSLWTFPPVASKVLGQVKLLDCDSLSIKIARKDVSISPTSQDITNFEVRWIIKVDKPFFKVEALHIEPEEQTRDYFGWSCAFR
jgi:hypothetical protein